MLNTQGEIKFSEYAVLYDMLIPADNKYRLIDELIDFSFIYDELKDKYSLDNGRKAAEPNWSAAWYVFAAYALVVAILFMILFKAPKDVTQKVA